MLSVNHKLNTGANSTQSQGTSGQSLAGNILNQTFGIARYVLKNPGKSLVMLLALKPVLASAQQNATNALQGSSPSFSPTSFTLCPSENAALRAFNEMYLVWMNQTVDLVDQQLVIAIWLMD